MDGWSSLSRVWKESLAHMNHHHSSPWQLLALIFTVDQTQMAPSLKGWGILFCIMYKQLQGWELNSTASLINDGSFSFDYAFNFVLYLNTVKNVSLLFSC